MTAIQKINIEDVIKKKNSKVLKHIPQFAINYLKRIIHQDVLNDFISRNETKNSLDFIKAGLKEFKVSFEVKGQENIKLINSPSIFTANHPIGGFDGVASILYVNENIGKAKAIINDVLLHMQNLKEVFIGVNSYGAKSKLSFKQINDFLNTDSHLIIFPSGLVSRRIKGVISDLNWKSTFIKQSVKHKRNVVPVHITGRLSNFFYNLSSLRTKLGIKANLEMLYLVDEQIKQKNQNLIITFGKPISYETFTDANTHKQWAENIRKHVYKIASNPSENFTY